MSIEETPLMKQYKEIKEKNKESILFFRLGDFYEMFFDDAKIASKELGLTLTSRNREKGMEVPLAGIPYHSSASYIAKLVAKGYKVAICEQVEDPKEAKGIVKREVVKIITPGTVIDVDYLDSKSNNYLLGIKIDEYGAGISYIDITTGEFYVIEFKGEKIKQSVINEVFKISPKEIILDSLSSEIFKEEIDNVFSNKNIAINYYNHQRKSEDILREYFNVISLESYGIADKKHCIDAGAMLLSYLMELQKSSVPINKIINVNISNFMELNLFTQKNLELIESEKSKTDFGTLLWVLDSTRTSMGARKLKSIIKNPLLDIEEIIKRQEKVSFFIENIILREEVKEQLKEVYDLERLMGKIILENENGRDMSAIKKSINAILNISNILIEKYELDIDKVKMLEIYKIIDEAIQEDAPFSIREGGIIKAGYSKELDEIHAISSSGKEFILGLEQSEREKTGIKSLKVGYNKVFGYYIEITNVNKEFAPINYIRKQTLSNAERYITPELKEYEDKVLNAKEKIEALEFKIFKEISEKIKESRELIQNIASKVAYLDVLISFSDAAVKNNYIKPEISNEDCLEIRDGRHPVVEKLIGYTNFVANDIVFNQSERVMILTGPNMAGKSTFMKQTALIILMAQIGSYVPATFAKIGIFDKIFTRIGASDDLVSGQSTFMVEMSEVSNILNNATERSFIILDEVGRGTSTFDGISIAWAITEYLSEKLKAKTVFATHYHELTELEKLCKNIINYRVEVKETESSVLFLRKIVRGGADKSYGIEVAKLAGLPQDVLSRSKKILIEMEKKRDIIEKKISVQQLSLFEFNGINEDSISYNQNNNEEILIEIKNIDVNNITPIEAMNILNELKKKIEKAGN